ncbi:nucleotidyltransferase family protein [Parafilimonas sp.]|uniref:nucleotidyltransferase family protein n=1 Tax=Parafilimonas sp. TaxID=1969739 RepID=UPI0039E41B37
MDNDAFYTLPFRGRALHAMLLAAGFGTRLKPFTEHHPKALAEVNGKSLLQRNLEYLQQFGIYNVVVNVHHFAEQIIQAIKEHNGWGSNVSISDETGVILETGGGLRKAAQFFKEEEDFVLMNVDVLTDLPLNNIIAFHKKNKPLATLATTSRETSRYFLFNAENVLCGWKNIKTGEEKIMRYENNLKPKAFSGLHIINTAIFSLMNQQGIKFSMVDVYLSLCASYTILSFDHSQTKFIDVGRPENIKKAAALFS